MLIPNHPSNSNTALPQQNPQIPETDESYAPKTKTPEVMHVLASIGLVMISYFIFQSLLKTVIGIAPILGIAGIAGFLSHAAYLYHSSKPRQILLWILWGHSCLLIAASIALFQRRMFP